MSPVKQLTYYSVERNHCISSPMKTNMNRLNMRDHVKGRLDFDTSDCEPDQGNRLPDDISVLKSDKDGDIFDLDLPNFDVLGVDFSFSELLGDFDPDGDFSSQPAVDSSPSSHSGYNGSAYYKYYINIMFLFNIYLVLFSSCDILVLCLWQFPW